MANGAAKTLFVTDLDSLEPQTAVSGLFALHSLSIRQGAKSKYLALVLADRTGQVDGRVWENFNTMAAACAEGCYVDVTGRVDRYQGKTQLLLSRMEPVEAAQITRRDFVPSTKFDPAQLRAELRSYIDGIAQPHLKALVRSFLNDPEIGPAFLEAPAAKKLHHAWLHGLLEHVVCLIRVIKAIAPMYPEANLDLVVTGAILHDMGKVRELSWESAFSYTLEGQLIGHISIVQRMLADKIAAMDALAHRRAAESGGAPDLFPEPLRLLLEHLLLAHHGKLEFGSPKLPMTPEALLFSTLDDLEAKFQTLRMEFESAAKSQRSPLQPTEWVRSMDRALFDSNRYLEASMPLTETPQPAEAESLPLFAGTAEPETTSTAALDELFTGLD